MPAREFPFEVREDVLLGDVDTVDRIVTSTNFFDPAEILVARELVDERLAKGLASGYHFCFAERDGRVRAYTCFGPIACTRSSWDLYWIAVEDESRNLGIGRRLLAFTERRIAEFGGTRIYVETSSRDRYLPTRTFYERMGYRIASLLEDFYAEGDAKVTFVKTLPRECGGLPPL